MRRRSFALLLAALCCLAFLGGAGCGSAHHGNAPAPAAPDTASSRRYYGRPPYRDTNRRMSYTPTSAVSAALHSYIDPNGGTCYTDAGATTAATNAGDTIASNKDPVTGVIGLKVGTRTMTLQSQYGIKAIRVDNASIGSGAAGAAIKYTSGTINTGNFTLIMAWVPDRRCKLVADMLFDAGNTPGTSANVCQIAHDSGNIKRSNGSGFSANTNLFIQEGVKPYLFAASASSGVVTFYRRDHYDSNGDLIGVTGGTYTAADGTGYTLLGRNANNLFTQGYLYFAAVCTTGLSAANVKSEMDNIKGYLEGLSGSTLKFGVQSSTAPLLITSGDSNECGTGATRITSEWGYQLQQGLITGGITGLEWISLGAGSRQETQEVQIIKPVADLANSTSGKVVIVYHVGENDLNGGTGASGLTTRYQTLFTNLKVLITNPNAKIILLGIPARTDISGTTLTNYDTERASLRTTMLGDTTLGSRINGYVDITGDSAIGANGASNTTTYFNGDRVHYNATGCTRVYNATDGTGSTLYTQALALFQGGSRRVTLNGGIPGMTGGIN